MDMNYDALSKVGIWSRGNRHPLHLLRAPTATRRKESFRGRGAPKREFEFGLTRAAEKRRSPQTEHFQSQGHQVSGQ